MKASMPIFYFRVWGFNLMRLINTFTFISVNTVLRLLVPWKVERSMVLWAHRNIFENISQAEYTSFSNQYKNSSTITSKTFLYLNKTPSRGYSNRLKKLKLVYFNYIYQFYCYKQIIWEANVVAILYKTVCLKQ